MKQPYDPHNPAISIACPLATCRAPGGAWCVTPTDRVAPWTHQARVRALRELEREAADAL